MAASTSEQLQYMQRPVCSIMSLRLTRSGHLPLPFGFMYNNYITKHRHADKPFARVLATCHPTHVEIPHRKGKMNSDLVIYLAMIAAAVIGYALGWSNGYQLGKALGFRRGKSVGSAR